VCEYHIHHIIEPMDTLIVKVVIHSEWHEGDPEPGDKAVKPNPGEVGKIIPDGSGRVLALKLDKTLYPEKTHRDRKPTDALDLKKPAPYSW
jgi:hypothetical protein